MRAGRFRVQLYRRRAVAARKRNSNALALLVDHVDTLISGLPESCRRSNRSGDVVDAPGYRNPGGMQPYDPGEERSARRPRREHRQEAACAAGVPRRSSRPPWPPPDDRDTVGDARMTAGAQPRRGTPPAGDAGARGLAPCGATSPRLKPDPELVRECARRTNHGQRERDTARAWGPETINVFAGPRWREVPGQ